MCVFIYRCTLTCIHKHLLSRWIHLICQYELTEIPQNWVNNMSLTSYLYNWWNVLLFLNLYCKLYLDVFFSTKGEKLVYDITKKFNSLLSKRKKNFEFVVLLLLFYIFNELTQTLPLSLLPLQNILECLKQKMIFIKWNLVFVILYI